MAGAEVVGEQGIYMEHASATEAVHHIPLVMYIPGVTKPGSVYHGFIYNLDVIATITDLAGLPKPSGWDGESFLPAIRGEHRQGRDYLLVGAMLFSWGRNWQENRGDSEKQSTSCIQGCKNHLLPKF